jgi:hypothetical protein
MEGFTETGGSMLLVIQGNATMNRTDNVPAELLVEAQGDFYALNLLLFME